MGENGGMGRWGRVGGSKEYIYIYLQNCIMKNSDSNKETLNVVFWNFSHFC